MIRLIRAELLVKLSTTQLFLWLGPLIVALSALVTSDDDPVESALDVGS